MRFKFDGVDCILFVLIVLFTFTAFFPIIIHAAP